MRVFWIVGVALCFATQSLAKNHEADMARLYKANFRAAVVNHTHFGLENLPSDAQKIIEPENSEPPGMWEKIVLTSSFAGVGAVAVVALLFARKNWKNTARIHGKKVGSAWGTGGVIVLIPTFFLGKSSWEAWSWKKPRKRKRKGKKVGFLLDPEIKNQIPKLNAEFYSDVLGFDNQPVKVALAKEILSQNPDKDPLVLLADHTDPMGNPLISEKDFDSTRDIEERFMEAWETFEQENPDVTETDAVEALKISLKAHQSALGTLLEESAEELSKNELARVRRTLKKTDMELLKQEVLAGE